MQLQAVFLILTIFVSYLVLGSNDASQNKASSSTAEPGLKEKISDMIVGALVIFNQELNSLENKADKLIALAKEAKQEKIEEVEIIKPDSITSSLSDKDFKSLPPEEFDSQIALYKINSEKTETELVSNNGVKCDFEKEKSLKTRTALIKYLDYNFNLFDFNSQKRWPIASVSKLMTSVIALEKLGAEKEIEIGASAVATEGTTGGFKAGEIFKVEDLIKAMMIVSSNDAAIALAEKLDKENFSALMNQKAKELGMNDTYYEEPSGLSFLNQSTANDLIKLANYIYNNHPLILEISRQKEIEITELKSKKSRKLLNIDRFAGQPDFIGGKTGYIDESGRNLIAFFNKNGKIVLTVVLGAENAFDETKKLISCY
jgi:D-alanyl-D-alanine carboxypeptidase (penicillin-binding protein 5/6)